jgi:hypothetical protein
MRDKLIRLLEETGMIEGTSRCNIVADELLANGVIVPPCKVGDVVYMIAYDEICSWIDEYKVRYFYYSDCIHRIYCECGTMGTNFRIKDIGKTVFLTEAEAEQAMKGGADNG